MVETQRVVSLTLDERTVARRTSDIEQERKVAIYDLLQSNHFAPVSGHLGPFRLHLGLDDGRLLIDVRDEADQPLDRIVIGLAAFRRIVKDYFVICDSYFEAIRTGSTSRIEAIDMGRRGLHNEAAELLRERLADQVDIDFDTARRLFTLLCVLQIRA